MPGVFRSTRLFRVTTLSNMSEQEEFSHKIEEALRNPRNLGEMEGADAVGTVGSVDCGDMLRMWVKFREEGGKRVIDRATFQTFGCETAIAVASVATELIAGKTPEEALKMDSRELSAPLGPLPPVKIHCAQLVESALRSALAPDSMPAQNEPLAPTLLQSFQGRDAKPKQIKLEPKK